MSVALGRPRRDFRAELARDKCWDAETERRFRTTGIPLEDCLLQNREELIALCELIEAQEIRSYLEIGVWTGRLVSTLHRLFDFDHVHACDIGWVEEVGLPLNLPFGIDFLRASSHSERYVAWRKRMPPVDLVMIDGDHTYEAVKHDFEINRRLPHRWLAFHDITGDNETTVGVKRLWDELVGVKIEIVRPHRELGLTRSTMGIGLWREG
ncbi:MAG: class I SAM-dependent methyltransferase [Deltaproteobacteria bacterium]|nr:class I SAM-dependent methyltransferase [Deltaproteobacteria bacterium]